MSSSSEEVVSGAAPVLAAALDDERATKCGWQLRAEKAERENAEARSALQAARDKTPLLVDFPFQTQMDEFSDEEISQEQRIMDLETQLAKFKAFIERLSNLPVDTSPNAVESGLTVAYWRAAAREALKV